MENGDLMKALIVVTGRGIGGDAVVALNVIEGLEAMGVQCEVALDESASGILFKRNGYDWHKITVPAAGGHVATKSSTVKAAFKSIRGAFRIRSLIKKLDVDFVVGVIGGGAIMASVGGFLGRIPAYSLICTPLDETICPKLNRSYLLTESHILNRVKSTKNVSKIYYPVNSGMARGDKDRAFERLRKEDKFDENKKTILFSSGSSIFKKIIEGANNFINFTEEYNIVLIGLPLHDEYLDELDSRIIYLGYCDWLDDLYEFIDLAVVTDDGLSIQEVVCCEIPSVCFTRVKWGRYHNMESIFKGATIEAEIDELNEKIMEAVSRADELRENCKLYSPKIISARDDLAREMIAQTEKRIGQQ